VKIEISDALAAELLLALQGPAAPPSSVIVDAIQAHLVTVREPIGTTALRFIPALVPLLPADDKAAFKTLQAVRTNPALAGWWYRDTEKRNKFGGAVIMWAAPAAAIRAHAEAMAERMAPAVNAALAKLEGQDQ
jgi:hypothetical protein